jgi:PAS domain S-box-containing protein
MTPEKVAGHPDSPTQMFELGHALTYSSSFAMALVDGARSTVRYANPAFCQFAGTTLDVLLGTSMDVCLPDHPECALLLARIHDGGGLASFAEQASSKSQLAPSCYFAWPIVAGDTSRIGIMLQVTETSEFRQQSVAVNQALMLSVVRQHELAQSAADLAKQMSIEITERKRGEAALQASQSRLLLALEYAKASTWEWDIAKNRVKWSDEIRVLSGPEKTTREASYRAWRSIIYPEDRGSVDSIAEQAARCCNELNVEFRVRRPDGLMLWMLAMGRLDRVETDQAMSYSGIILDITERKHAEQVLLRNEKLAGVGRMAATLAHEINNPLDAAINALYIVRTNPQVPPPAHEFLDIADEELRRVVHMTRQSLGVYREATLPTVIPVETVLESVLGLLKNRIATKSAKIERQYEAELSVHGVFGELRQVFVNLVSNSLDFLNVGGTITLRTSRCAPLEGGSPRIRITVADTGKGIGSLQLTRIFEPFFTTKGELGTGLGLWVTKQIVEQHGGSIQVRSNINPGSSGTTFSILLPQ